MEQLARLMNLAWTDRETVEDQPIVFPSPETVAELYELALMGDANVLTERVSVLVRSNSRLQPFAVRIQRFLERYQLDEISQWLAPHKEGKE